MQVKGDTIVCKIFHHVACFSCGKGIATSYDGSMAVRKMARQAGAKKMLIGDGDPIKQWYCKSCAAEHRVQTDADWSCKNCGFENHGSWSECGECQTPRS